MCLKSLHETPERSGEINLMSKFYLCLLNFSEKSNLFFEFSWEIAVCGIIAANYLYL